MSQPLTAKQFLEKLQTYKSSAELAKYDRYFPVAARGEDQFLGVRMGQIFTLAKDFVGMPLDEVEKLLENPYHEARVGAVSILDYEARSKKTPPERRKALFDLYLRRHDRINTWDLVDRSAIHVVGGYLADKPREVLYKLAESTHPMERRTAIVSTFYFLGQGEKDDTFRIAEVLMNDKNEFVQKAVGWALRTAGGPELLAFLDEHAAHLARITLRYAIEKLASEQKKRYLAAK